MKRLGIFVCSDQEGIIDDYITYLLKDICNNLDDLYIVSNTTLTLQSQEKLNRYTSHEIKFNLNNDFDENSWQDAMVNIVGFEKLIDYDEVILFNDSFFGPFYPFKHIFEKMNGYEIDFWGLTYHGEMSDKMNKSPFLNHPRFIQTHFLAFRKNLIQSNEFQNYWINLPKFKDYNDLVINHKLIFTDYFSKLGFKWKSFVDSEYMDENKGKAMNFYTFDMYNLITNMNLPILNKQSFLLPRETHLSYNNALELSKIIEYLKDNSNYDIMLIFNHLLRIVDSNQLVEILNLSHVFQKNQLNNYKSDKKVLLIAHLYYDDIWEYAFKYLNNVPDYIDIIITTNSYIKKEFFEKNIAINLKNKCKVIKIESRGRDMASIFVACRSIVKNYDYFCFMHDKKSQGTNFITIGSTFRDILWENMLASENYINNIIKELDDNPYLGLIVPPRVYHGNYFYVYVNDFWVQDFDITTKLLDELGINVPINKNYPPLSIGNCFWARYDALEPLFEFYLTYEDFPEEPLPIDGSISHALERIYGYVAASRGYCTEIIMTDEYASSEISNYSHMLINTLKTINSKNLNNVNLMNDFLDFHYSFESLLNKNNKLDWDIKKFLK